MMVVGLTLVLKTHWFLAFFGRVRFAERYLGTEGGTRLFYKLLGVLVFIVGLILLFQII